MIPCPADVTFGRDVFRGCDTADAGQHLDRQTELREVMNPNMELVKTAAPDNMIVR